MEVQNIFPFYTHIREIPTKSLLFRLNEENEKVERKNLLKWSRNRQYESLQKKEFDKINVRLRDSLIIWMLWWNSIKFILSLLTCELWGEFITGFKENS